VTNVQIDVDGLDDCIKSEELTVAAPTTSGQYTWYARAYDSLGNFAYSFQQTTFSVDADPPEILNPRLFKQGAQVDFTDVGTNEYQLKVEIREENELESDPVLDIASGPGSCTPIGDINYECTWNIIATTTTTSRTISGTITAEDKLGNSISKDISVGIGIDADAPFIGFWGSEYGDYVKEDGNTLKLHAQEQESGFDETTVYADLHLLNPSYGSSKHPDECDEEWCYWYDIEVTRPEGEYGARVYISDFIGHQSFSDTVFTVDKTPPVITGIIQEPPFPTAELGLVFFVDAEDNNGIFSGAANVSDISSQKDWLIGECIEERDISTCFFNVFDLKTYATPGDIVFNITDLAGNSVSDIHEMILFESDLDAIPNEIDVSVREISPATLKREIATNIPTKIFVGLDFDKSDYVDVVGRTQANCEGIQELNLLPNFGNENPYWVGNEYIVFEVLLDNATAVLENIEFNCTVDFTIRKRSRIFFNPEVERIYANISLENISTMDDRLVDKLEDLHRVIEEDLLWAQEWDEVVQRLINICDYFNYFKETYDLLQTFKPILYVVVAALDYYPPTKKAADSLWRRYNQLVCYMAVAKNYAWPNSNPDNLGDLNSERTTGMFVKWEGLRGWVRNICAIVKCRQCNTDWGISNRLANLNPDWDDDVWDPDEVDSATNLNRYLNGTAFEDVDLSVRVDPFKSWAVALGCLCIPGLIHNVKKYRQIECMHANCLIQSAKFGQSTEYCEQEDAVRKCVFVWGAILHLIPGYLFIRMIVTKIADVLTNLPARFVISLRNKMCDLYDRGLATSGPQATKLGRAQDAKDCKASNMPAVPDPGNGNFILCSLLDLAMLRYAWDDLIDNAYDPEDYELDLGDDHCDDIDWEGAGVDD
jgi:hypothetical protein